MQCKYSYLASIITWVEREFSHYLPRVAHSYAALTRGYHYDAAMAALPDGVDISVVLEFEYNDYVGTRYAHACTLRISII